MGPTVAEPINPYAPPQCAAGPPPPRARELDEPILIRGEINLAHEVLVMRRLNGRSTKWITRLLALLALCAVALLLHRFWQTGDRNALLAAIMPLFAASFLLFLPWILFGLYVAVLGLLGIAHQKPFWALVTNDGVRTRGRAGEEFQPWSSFSRMELAGELIALYGCGNLRNLPVIIFNIHWCARSADQDRLWSLLEARFGRGASEAHDPSPAKDRPQLAAAPHPTLAGEEPIVLAGLVDLDQLLRIQRLQRQPQILLFVSVVVILAIALVGTILWWSEPQPELWAKYGMNMAVAGLLYVLCLFKSRIDAWLLRRSFASGRTRPQWTTWTISASGVSLLTAALETHESWSQLQYRGESENMLVLFNRASYRFHFLPREFATDEQWDALRRIVRENAVRK